MKSTVVNILLLTVFCACISLSCNKEKLTKATQTGANTFSCKVEGKVFVPSTEKPSFSGPSRPLLVSNSAFNGFMLSAYNHSSYEFPISVSIGLPYLKRAGTYSLQTVTGYGEYKLEYAPGPIYRTNNSNTGTINITRCDTINRIYSGTFSFKAVNVNTGKAVNVTNGRFDVNDF